MNLKLNLQLMDDFLGSFVSFMSLVKNSKFSKDLPRKIFFRSDIHVEHSKDPIDLKDPRDKKTQKAQEIMESIA